MGGDRLHLPRPQVAAPGAAGEVLLRASLGRYRRPPGRGVERRGARRAGWAELGALTGLTGAPTDGRGRALAEGVPPVPGASPAADGRDRAAAGPRWRRWPWPASAYRGVGIPACIASGRAAAHVPSREPARCGRGRVVLPSLAAGVLLALSLPPWGWWPLGLAGAGAPLLAPRRAARCAPASGPGGWPGWAVTPSASSGPAPSTGTAPWCSILVEALFFAAAAALDAADRGRACLRRRVHAGRGGPDDVALRRAPARRRVPRAGRRPARPVGPPRRPAAAHRRRVGGRRRRSPRRVAGSAARRSQCGRAVVVGAVVVAVGLVGPGRGRRRWPPTAGPGPDGPGGAGPGRRQRGLSKEQVSPTHGLRRAQLAATHAWQRPRPSSRLVVWPEDVVALDRPVGRVTRGGRRSSRLAKRLDTTLLAGVTEPASADHVPQRDRGLGPERATSSASSRRCTACPFGEYVPFRSLLRPLRRSLGRADRRRTRPRHRPDAHAGRAARAPGVLRGLLRRPQPRIGAGRGRTADRPDQHVVLRHRRRCRPRRWRPTLVQAVETGRDLVQAAPTGFSAVVDQRGVVRRAHRSRAGARCSSPRWRCAAASHRTTTGATSRCWSSPGWRSARRVASASGRAHS